MNEFIVLHDISDNLVYFNISNVIRFYKAGDFTTIVTREDFDSVKESPDEILEIIRGEE